MKKILFISFCCFCFNINGFTQEGQVFEKRAQNVYFELFGSGGFYSFNYETRFNDTNRGLGGRIGLGIYGVKKFSDLAIPITINYLFGRPDGQHYFEAGIGYTYFEILKRLEFKSEDKVINFTGTSYAHFIVGYNYRPPSTKWMFKFTVNPLVGKIDNKASIIPWLGAAIGKGF